MSHASVTLEEMRPAVLQKKTHFFLVPTLNYASKQSIWSCILDNLYRTTCSFEKFHEFLICCLLESTNVEVRLPGSKPGSPLACRVALGGSKPLSLFLIRQGVTVCALLRGLAGTVRAFSTAGGRRQTLFHACHGAGLQRRRPAVPPAAPPALPQLRRE